MERLAIKVKHSVFINKPPEVVWDFTQDYRNRKKWDNSIVQADVVESYPNRVVNIKARGNTSMTFVYKVYDRPNRTTLTAKGITSPIILSAGGSWIYENHKDGTLWIQVGTVILKDNILFNLILPVYRMILKRQIKKAMLKAKLIIEKSL